MQEVVDAESMQDKLQRLESKVDNLEAKVDRVLELLEPVHAHAEFVGNLKTWCYNKRMFRLMLPDRTVPESGQVDCCGANAE